MKKIIKISQKGFTLVELLLYMGILSIFISILTSIFISALDVKLESEATSSIQQDATYTLAKLSYDVNRAESISIPSSLGDQTNNLLIRIGGVDYIYSIDLNDNLILTNNLGTNNLNGYNSKISNLLVKRFGNVGELEDTLKINFTITSRVRRPSGFETKNIETNLSLRRK